MQPENPAQKDKTIPPLTYLRWFPGKVNLGGVNAVSGVDDVVGIHINHVQDVLHYSLSLLFTA